MSPTICKVIRFAEDACCKYSYLDLDASESDFFNQSIKLETEYNLVFRLLNIIAALNA